MNKLTILFLTMLLTCLPMAMRADSHKEKEMIPDTLRELFR